MRLPHFVCIGTYKAATTWLFRSLNAHPDVFIPDGKEVHFFCRRMGYDAYERNGVPWYASLYGHAPEGAKLGDISPGYLASSVAPERMAAVLPDARIIVMLRNPTDRLWSHHCFVEGMTRGRRSWQRMLDEERGDDDGMVEQGFFATHLERWYARFPRQRLQVHLLEDVKHDPEGVFRSICSFIGVDDAAHISEVRQRSNDSRRMRSPLVYRASFRVARFLALNGGDPVRRAIKGTGLPGLLHRWNRVSVKNAPMPEGFRREVSELYREDLERLTVLLGRDVTPWSRGEPVAPAVQADRGPQG